MKPVVAIIFFLTACQVSTTTLPIATPTVPPIITPSSPPLTQLTVEPAKLYLVAGDSKLVKAMAYRADGTLESTGKLSFKWSSEDRTIAQVDETGKILAIKAGETHIKTTLADSSLEQRTQVVVVAKTSEVKVIVTPTQLQLKISQQAMVQATVILPDGSKNANVNWSSSDDRILAVNPSGAGAQVTALSPGTATAVATYIGKDSTDKGFITVEVQSE